MPVTSGHFYIILLYMSFLSLFLSIFFAKNQAISHAFPLRDTAPMVSRVTSANFISSTPKIARRPMVLKKKAIQKFKPAVPKPTPIIISPVSVTPVVVTPTVSTTASPAVSSDGILFFTNQARQDNGGLAPLQTNSILNSMAAKRVDDMFAYQYFSHTSPDNIDMINLAKTDGYNYSAIGENIIRGDFDSAVAMVNAWMNSPGHRANILNTKYTEIGIAVKKGMYEGRMQWIGVQIFGHQMN